MIKDYLLFSWKEMKRRKLRSWLTLLGIIIGIAAVVALITLGQGLQNAIAQQFNALGNDKLFIAAKGSSLTAGLSIDAVKITMKDLDIIRRIPSIKRATGLIYTTVRIEFNDNVRYFFLTGMPTEKEERVLVGEAQNYKILKGRPLEHGDTFKAVVGYEYTKEGLFGRTVEVGDRILIHDKEFTVVGIWDRTGSPPDDQGVMIPLETYADLLNTDDELGILIAQVEAGEDTGTVGEEVEKELRKYRRLEEGKEDFSVETPQQLAATFSTVLDIVQIVLVGIAAISLFVGGIGIMNTMYTAVLQRTRDIGVMKAVGAKNSQILVLFLLESGLYGLGGGIIGVLVGSAFAKIVEAAFAVIIGPAFLSISLDPLFMSATLLFSFVVGCLSGIAPARRASTLNPVESLRYE